MKKTAKKGIFALLIATSTSVSLYGYNGGDSWFRKGKATLMRTHVGFHISRFYNKLRHGSNFTFHQIAGDGTVDNLVKGKRFVMRVVDRNNISITYDGTGALLAINDGKKTPLVLGSIPDRISHITKLKKEFQTASADNKSIGIFTLNEPWECDAAGLSKLIHNNNELIQYHYATPDFGAPSLIDLIRAVRDLENRDNGNMHVALVHCKAGRGRSATVAGAYVAHLIHQTDITATVEQIEKYLIRRRSQVGINAHQKAVLAQFIAELKDAGSFDALCARYKEAIEQRDQEIATLF